ncbi:hypothetical protein [Actomonas aquatica]|uniref:Mandelate racemase n=1 Tax=Actomonas aquatica TaxID=2866162 RepID=A0ABZ1CE08_9BACT|nr:hypothetical protein [Opitutus sp. WL0086]WRQ89600.1 hypothetical protein K1X11_009280 [Opitutus sp. WL0086]
MITIHAQRWYRRELRTRLPFHYGITVMEQVPHAWLELEATIDGERVRGRAADHLPPKWFTKDPMRSIGLELAEMYTVLRKASAAASGQEARSVHALVQTVDEAQRAEAAQRGWPALLAHFGVSLVERALIDAFCRRHRCSVVQAVRDGGLGIRLGDLHEELGDQDLDNLLPRTSVERVFCRHTVGLGDALDQAEAQTMAAGVDDGLPVDLRAVIRHYGVREFKIKVGAEVEAGLDRLERVTAVIEAERGTDYAATLDGNEAFETVDALREFWARGQERPRLRNLWGRLRFFEQPLHRAVALNDETAAALPRWWERPALLIDESGAEPADLRRALAIGYAGVSHKNCKGVIHGIANRCLLTRRGGNLLMSGEDLSNVGPVALPQDLAVQALLGNTSVERNGHHYFAGLAGWPQRVNTAVLARYAGLYGRPAEGRGATMLQVRKGEIDVRAATDHAFGGAWDLGLDGAGECWAEFS